MNKYIGMREIKSIDGNKVTFASLDKKILDKDVHFPEYTQMISQKAQQYLITDEPIDEETTRRKRINTQAQAIMDVLMEHGFMFYDLSSILNQVNVSIDMYRGRADAKLASKVGQFDGDLTQQIQSISILDVENFLNS